MHPHDRVDALLQGVDLHSEVGLEIGPLDKPIVSRAPGRRIYYADYASRDVLRAKSVGDPSVDVQAIVPVDYLIADLPERLDRTFDFIVASHVIEHVPDPVGWLATLFGWLAPGGRVVLAIPDKRYCFDVLRPLSTTGQIIQAKLDGRRRPTFASIYDGMCSAVRFDLAHAWREDPYRGSLEPIFSPEVSFQTALRAHRSGEHVDCHSWVFTHASFLKIIGDLHAHGILGVRVVRESAPVTYSNEFHIVLAPA